MMHQRVRAAMSLSEREEPSQSESSSADAELMMHILRKESGEQRRGEKRGKVRREKSVKRETLE